MSQKSHSTSSACPPSRAIARVSNSSQDFKFSPDVSGSAPLFPDSSSSYHTLKLHETSHFRAKPQEEEDLIVPITFDGLVLPLHSSREILGDVPIQKNNHIPIYDATFMHAEQPSLGAETRSYMGSTRAVVLEDVISPTVHAAAKKNGKAPNRKIAQSPESKATEMNFDERVSHYINQAKLKIRTTSIAGGGKGEVEKGTVHDRFANYINRAKVRLRTTLSISERGIFQKNEKP